MKKYQINGYVLIEKSHKPLSGLTIEAWDGSRGYFAIVSNK